MASEFGQRSSSCSRAMPSTDAVAQPDPAWFVEDTTAALASFRKLMDVRPRVLCPGHGDPFTGST